MYSFLLPMIGIDKKVALQKIDSLEQMLNNQTNNPMTLPNESQQSSLPMSQNDDLERFRKGLNSFKQDSIIIMYIIQILLKENYYE